MLEPHLKHYRDYLMLVGDIATHYASFEHAINESIWILAGVDERIGGCITAELISHAPKFRILIALMYERKVDKLHIDSAKKLSKDAIPISQYRNKYIHSPMGLGIKNDELIPMITHSRNNETFESATVPYDIAEMLKRSEKVQKLKNDATNLKRSIFYDLELNR